MLVLNHGTGPDRVIHRAYPWDAEFVEWFLRRGFIVVSPVRRGYGATGGPWAEGLAVGPRGVRNCDGVGMLWLYATTDFYFLPDLGRAMHRAFTEAGGKAEFVETGISGYDGHGMFGSFTGTQR